MNELFFTLFYTSIEPLRIVYTILIWSILLFLVGSSCSAVNKGIKIVKRLHQIPCSNCKFFTENYQLKCPVNPTMALTEDAINCLDYEPLGNSTSYQSIRSFERWGGSMKQWVFEGISWELIETAWPKRSLQFVRGIWPINKSAIWRFNIIQGRWKRKWTGKYQLRDGKQRWF